MANMMKMIKQAQAMQKNMENMQAELAERDVDFSSGGGMVKAVCNGEGTLQSIAIDPKVVDTDDVEMLEDLVLAAVQGASNAAKEMMADEMGKITKGMNIPGMPF